MNFDSTTYTFKDPGKIGIISLVVGVVFLGISAIGYMNDSAHFYLNYLTALVFWLSVSLGCLFFTMLHHITQANWSTVLRKVSEALASAFPLFLILFIPIIFGLHDLFHWSHEGIMDPASENFDALLAKKEGFLNPTFFYIRSAGYFAIWIIFSLLLNKSSAEQDKSHTPALARKFRKISAPGIILFALSSTFASFDWLMALDAHWFSTIFGVYYFSGAFLSGLTFLVIVLLYLRKNGILKNEVTIEHYHDLMKLIFGFIIFWSYMAFSQYFLIWYANLPEENFWFLYRWDNSWEPVSLLLIFGHFVFPFIALIFRASKRFTPVIFFMCSWILIMRYVDLYWLVLPSHYRDGIHFSILDLAPLIGIGGLFFFYFWRQLTSKPLLALNDPTLEKSMKFLNS